MLCVSFTWPFFFLFLTDRQTTRDQITRDRRSKRTWSNCVLCIPFILGGSPNKCWLLTCDACVITTWRLGLRTLLVARNNNASADFCASMLLLHWSSGISDFDGLAPIRGLKTANYFRPQTISWKEKTFSPKHPWRTNRIKWDMRISFNEERI